MTTSLTPRQQHFVDEYTICLNGTQAAIRAGYNEKSAGSRAYHLLRKNSRVATAVERNLAERSSKSKAVADWIFDKLAEITLASPGDVIAWEPEGVTVKDLSGLSAEALKAIEAAVVDRGTITVTLDDQRRALKLLRRRLKAANRLVDSSRDGAEKYAAGFCPDCAELLASEAEAYAAGGPTPKP